MLIILAFACVTYVVSSYHHITQRDWLHEQNIMPMMLQVCARYCKLLKVFATFYYFIRLHIATSKLI